MPPKRQHHRSNSASESSSSDSEAEEVADGPIQLVHQEIDRPLAGHLRRHRIKQEENSTPCRNFHQFLNASQPILTGILVEMLQQLRSFKYQMRLKLDFHKAAHPETTAEAYFAHCQSLLLTPDDIDRSIENNFAEMASNVEAFERRGSGWVIRSVGYLDVHFARYQPLKGSSWIQLPTCLAKSKAIINPQNHNDDKCFLYSVLAAIHPEVQHPARIQSWRYLMDSVQTDCLQFPVSLSQIPKV